MHILTMTRHILVMLTTAHPLVSNWSSIVCRFICKREKNNKFGRSDRIGSHASWQQVAVDMWLGFNIGSFLWFHTNEYDRVTHIFRVINYVINGSDNVDTKLLPKLMMGYEQLDTWDQNNVECKFKFSFKFCCSFIEMDLEISFANCRPFCLGISVSTHLPTRFDNIVYIETQADSSPFKPIASLPNRKNDRPNAYIS